jgi:hypothetical protein
MDGIRRGRHGWRVQVHRLMEEEISFHEDGDDVPWWLIAALLAGVAVVSGAMIGLIFSM